MVHAHDNEAAMLEGVMIPLGFSVQEEILVKHIIIHNDCSEWKSLVQT